MSWGNIIQKVDAEKRNWWKHSAEHISQDGKMKKQLNKITINVENGDQLFELEKHCFREALEFKVNRCDLK